MRAVDRTPNTFIRSIPIADDRDYQMILVTSFEVTIQGSNTATESQATREGVQKANKGGSHSHHPCERKPEGARGKQEVEKEGYATQSVAVLQPGLMLS